MNLNENMLDDIIKKNAKRIKKKRIMKYTLIAILLIFIGIGLDHRLKVVHYNFKGNMNLKIAHVTDLHGCYYGKDMKTLVDAINKEKPDIIVYSGDIFDDEVPYKNSIIFIENTREYPSYYVNGNHEYWSNDMDNIRKILDENGVTILDDMTAIYEKDGKKVNISGIEDPCSGKDLDTQLKSLDVDDDAYNILLAHRPENIDKYLEYDFDTICVGHAHGGQWRIPYLINGLIAPNQGLFPKYAGGLYYFDDTHFVVSRGLARESTKFVPRFYNRPELVIIEISEE